MRAETSELISFSGAADPVVRAADSARPAPAPRRRFDMAALPGVTRAQQVAMALEQAPADARFCGFVASADAARDRGDWITAEQDYGQALRLFPLHWGYCIQYAHAIKEQGLHPRAEAWYRSAVALGAPGDMVDQHLAFVARVNGVQFVRRGMPDLSVPPMCAPPTVHDVRLLGELARVPGLAGDDLALDLLRHAPDNRAALLRIMAAPQFARSNRPFLDILRNRHA